MLQVSLDGVRSVSGDQARLGALAFVDVLRYLDEPFGLSFRVRCAQQRLHAGFVITGFDDPSTRRAADRVLELAAATMPWYGFAPPSALTELALPARPARIARITEHGVAQQTAAVAATVWTLPSPQTDDALQAVHAAPRVAVADASPLARGLLTQPALVSVSVGAGHSQTGRTKTDVVVTSDGDAVDVLAALAALELGGDLRSDVETFQGPDAAQGLATHGLGADDGLDDEAFARLLSLPARCDVPSVWARSDLTTSRACDVVEALEAQSDQHRWILGRTGTGKTTLLAELVRRDLARDKRVVVIDPHGDLADRVTATVSQIAPGELTELNFGAAEPPAFELLQPEPGQHRDGLIAEVIDTLRDVFYDSPESFYGPVFQRTVSYVLRMVLATGVPRPLEAVVRVLGGDRTLGEQLAGKAGGDYRRSWHNEMSQFLNGQRSDPSTTWVASKLDPFIADARMQRIFASDETGRTLAEVLAGSRVVVVRVPIATMGSMAPRVIAACLVNRLGGLAGRAFEDRRLERCAVALYVDEWHRIAQSSVSRLLAEGRKYGLEITLANQTVAQITDPTHVAGAVGTLAAFRVGPREAALLAPEFVALDADTLRRLPRFACAVRTPDGDEVVGALARQPEPIPK